MKLIQPLKMFWNYFSDIGHVGKYSRAVPSQPLKWFWNHFRQVSTC